MNQNPIHGKGYRNVLCPDYRACLDCRLKEKQNLVIEVCLSQGVDDVYYSRSPSLYQTVKKCFYKRQITPEATNIQKAEEIVFEKK